jgi:hypothetical protein
MTIKEAVGWAIFVAILVGAMGVLADSVAESIRSDRFAQHCAALAAPGHSGFATEHKGEPACLFVEMKAVYWLVPQKEVNNK